MTTGPTGHKGCIPSQVPLKDTRLVHNQGPRDTVTFRDAHVPTTRVPETEDTTTPTGSQRQDIYSNTRERTSEDRDTRPHYSQV